MKAYMTSGAGQYFMTPDKTYSFNNNAEILSDWYAEPKKILTEYLFERKHTAAINELKEWRSVVGPIPDNLDTKKKDIEDFIAKNYPDQIEKSFSQRFDHFHALHKKMFSSDPDKTEIKSTAPLTKKNLDQIYKMKVDVKKYLDLETLEADLKNNKNTFLTTPSHVKNALKRIKNKDTAIINADGWNMYNVPAIHKLTRDIGEGIPFEEKMAMVNNFMPRANILDLRSNPPKTVRLADHVFKPGKGKSLARK